MRPAGRVLLGAGAAALLLFACAPTAVAGPPSCGKDYYGQVWVASTGPDQTWSWPTGVLVPAYDNPLPASPAFYGDGSWYTHGGTRKDKIVAVFQVSGCRYPKFDFLLSLGDSTRLLYATVPDAAHPDLIDPWHLNVDRMASVPVTTDNTDFRTFCGGPGASSVVLNSQPLVLADDGYPDRIEGVLMDNYAGCFEDPAGNYYVRRMMAIGFDELDSDVNRTSAVLLLGRSTIRDGSGADCAECSTTSFVRVYHPDANTWVVAPESPFEAVYKRYVDNAWGFVQYATVPFAMVVKRLPQ